MFGLVVVFEFFQFGEAVYHIGNGFAKFGGQLDFAGAGVFQYIVHQAGAEGLDVHVPFGQLSGHRDGVGDVRLTAFAGLTVMRVERIGTGFFQLGEVVVAQVGSSTKQQRAGFCG